MNRVDWESVLSGLGITVQYSSLTIPDVRTCDGTVASIALPAGYGLDISWYGDDGVYVVRLFQGPYENSIGEMEKRTPEDVVEFVAKIGKALSPVHNIAASAGVAPVELSRADDTYEYKRERAAKRGFAAISRYKLIDISEMQGFAGHGLMLQHG
jgi:hypothetical protein